MKKKSDMAPSPSFEASGYESEDSSVNEVDLDSSAEVEEEGIGQQIIKDNELTTDGDVNENDKADASLQAEVDNYVLKCKSVYKCKLCPRIVCLSETSIITHLSSKRHARSKKLLGEGRLKLMLNSDGELEEDEETHAERHNRIAALVQDAAPAVKKDSGRQRQNMRRKRRLRNKTKSEDAKKNPEKKSRKDQNATTTQ